MKCFIYKLKDDMGRNIYGVIDARSVKDVKKKVKIRDTFFVSAKQYSKKKLFKRTVKFQTLIMFTRRLTSLIEAGIPILTAMNILWKQSEDQTIQLIVSHMKSQLEEGNRISKSMECFPKIFPTVYIALIHVGEKSGALVQILRKLSEYLEYKAGIIARTKKATLYPAIVIVFSIIVIMGMFIFVVPIFQKILFRLNVDLPMLTLSILKISLMLRTGLFWLGVVIVLPSLYFIYRQMKKIQRFNLAVDEALLRIPYFGDILLALSLSQLLRSLSILLGAGVPITECLEVSNVTAGNKKIMVSLERVKKKVEQGASLYDSFRKEKVFPLMLIEMLGVGESSGMMVPILERVTKHFDEEVDFQLNKFLTILEPVLIIAVGGMVIITLMAIYMPIISIWKGLLN